MFRYLMAICLLALCSCQTKHTGEVSRYLDSGAAKPTVAIVPVIDSSGFELPWSLSEELTALISERLNHQGTLFVSTKTNSAFLENPFASNISAIKKEFHDYEFVVFLELIDHQKTPEKKDAKDSADNLNMAMRIRVVDNRDKQPKVILQELLKDSYFISKNILHTDYSQVTWNTPSYANTPFGLAHAELAKNVVERLNDYINIAKNGSHE